MPVQETQETQVQSLSFRMNGKPFILDYQVPTPTPISSPAPSLAHICSSCFSELFLKHTKHVPISR